MATRRQIYPITYFRGMHDAASPMDPRYWVRAGYLADLRNYHVADAGLRKRQGTTPLIAATVGSANPILGLSAYEWDTTRYLLALCNGSLRYQDGSAWTAITGALSFSTDSLARMRTCHFNDGSNRLIVGCNGAGFSVPFLWTGSGNATELSGTGRPAYAADCCNFHDHLFFINTPAGPFALQFAKGGTTNNWPSNNLLDATRDAVGVGLARHSQEVMLAFYTNSIHRVTYSYGGGTTSNFFQVAPVDGSIGCPARNSIITVRGKTYFVGSEGSGEGARIIKGIYVVGDPTYPAKFLSDRLASFWATLAPDRHAHITAFSLGGNRPEIGWNVTVGGAGETRHNHQIIYNTEEDAFSVFDSPNAALLFNAGCAWTNSDGESLTALGGYDGVVYDAYGDPDYHNTGNLDGGSGGSAVEAYLETGYLDLGYRGEKKMRQVWVDVFTRDQISFTGQISTAAEAQITNRTMQMGTAAARLDAFTLDTSRLASTGPTQAKQSVKRKGRWFKYAQTESGTSDPHVVAGISFAWMPTGARIGRG